MILKLSHLGVISNGVIESFREGLLAGGGVILCIKKYQQIYLKKRSAVLEISGRPVVRDD